jgi:multidrug transporter EmrE-like cation transporter
MFLVVALLLNASANILIKLAATRTGSGGTGLAGALTVYLSPWFVGGVVCFGLNLLAYSLALQKIPLVVAYPIMVGSGYMIMVLASRLLLGETLTWLQAVGAILILAGLVLIVPRSFPEGSGLDRPEEPQARSGP